VKPTFEPPEKPTTRFTGSRALLGPVATVFATVDTGSWRLARPEVDFSACSGCGVCRTHCPTGVVEIVKDQAECVVIGWENCKGCGICANLCPKGCITMVGEGNRDAR
jgi:pyruvate ferredoxin oxidoreductase delta subunit